MSAFSMKECAWAQTELKILGATITGIRGFEFKPSMEKEVIYAAGQKPIDITMGNESFTGSISLLKFEFDKLNQAAIQAGYKSLLHVPHPLILITCVYKLSANSPSEVIETPFGVGFTDITIAMQQNAKMTEVPLPFIAMDIVMRKR